MANSKKNIYIPTDNQSYSTDNFRNVCGNYWVTPGEDPQYGDLTSRIPQPSQTPNQPIKEIRKVDSFRMIPRSKKRQQLESMPYYQITEEFEVYAEKSKYGSTN